MAAAAGADRSASAGGDSGRARGPTERTGPGPGAFRPAGRRRVRKFLGNREREREMEINLLV